MPKLCAMCGKLKDESEFPKDRTRKDGLHQRCKSCKNEYSRQRYKTQQELSDETTVNTDLKKCSGCGELKTRSDFSKDRTKKDGLYHLCKICRSSYRRKNQIAKKKILEGANTGGADCDNKEIGVLSTIYSGDESGVCGECGTRLTGFISGYLHGHPVCKDCVLVNLKFDFSAKSEKSV